MSIHHGGCHCGALRWSFDTRLPLGDFAPRQCDCDFCTRHGAAWVSDANGSLRIQARPERLQRYRQGSGQAQFLLCNECGVLVAVIACNAEGQWLGAVNRNAFDQSLLLGAAVMVSPQQLPAESKLARWSQVWSPVDVEGA